MSRPQEVTQCLSDLEAARAYLSRLRICPEHSREDVRQAHQVQLDYACGQLQKSIKKLWEILQPDLNEASAMDAKIAKAEEAEKQAEQSEKRAKTKLKKIQQDLKWQKELVAHKNKMIQELGDKNLSRPPIKQLVDALLLLMMVQTTLHFEQDENDINRKVHCGSHEIAQQAILAAGAPCKFPAARMAWEQSLQAYYETNEQVKKG